MSQGAVLVNIESIEIDESLGEVFELGAENLKKNGAFRFYLCHFDV